MKRGREVSWGPEAESFRRGPGAEPLVGVQGAKPPENFRVFVTGNVVLTCKVGQGSDKGGSIDDETRSESELGCRAPGKFLRFCHRRPCSELQNMGADDGLFVPIRGPWFSFQGPLTFIRGPLVPFQKPWSFFQGPLTFIRESRSFQGPWSSSSKGPWPSSEVLWSSSE